MDSLRDELNTNLQEYDSEKIQEAIAYETATEDRKGAHEALESAFDELTREPENTGDYETDAEGDGGGTTGGRADESGDTNGDGTAPAGALKNVGDPNEPAAASTAMNVPIDDLDEDGQVAAARVVDGMGATQAGTAGVVLPAPELDSAPDTVRVFTPVKGSIGQSSTPYGVGAHDVPYTRQVKNQLETDTNRLRLDESDPLHPSNNDGGE